MDQEPFVSMDMDFTVPITDLIVVQFLLFGGT